MLRPKLDEAFERKNAWRFYGFLIGAVVLSQCWLWEGVVARLVAAGVGVVVGFVLASLWEKVAVWLYRCPNCRTRIGRPLSHYRKGDRVIMHCPECMMQWDLGLRADGGGETDVSQYEEWWD